MKIFGVGLSKTGTNSLTEALKILGYKSLHTSVPYEILDYETATDSPVAARYKELDIIFPNSKFILTTREFESWAISFANHRKKYDLSQFIKILRFEIYWTRAKIYGMVEGFTNEYAIECHKKHIAEVREYFKDRKDFMELDICAGEGWEKLCPFLEKSAPSVSFPWKNKA